jgi:methyltransferase (TIGR00027 family)
MKPGNASRTAVYVCMARAAADGVLGVGRFSDPVAIRLLSDDARARVERFRAGVKPRNAREGFGQAVMSRRAGMMVARTVAIDDAVRAAGCPQVVILGAGLDGRAWRMDALRDATVFEVDHPDSQREKRERAAGLTRVAKDVRYVPVDFATDSLAAKLDASGHDPTKPTMWIWEGVVMYLTAEQIDATLEVVRRRSASSSHISVAYVRPALKVFALGWFFRRIGEPMLSRHTRAQMRALLARHGFEATRDEDCLDIGRGISPAVARLARDTRHLRVVTARRAS